MKKIFNKLNQFLTGYSILTLLTLGVANAGTITGTSHDMSAQGFTGGQICVVCHTPHNSNTSVTEAPLWNHDVTAVSFTMYSSGTLDSVPDGQPTGISKLCLSCHDGVTAIDSFGGSSGDGTATMTTTEGAGNKAVGGDSNSLTNDHPISITYNTALSVTDPGLHNPSTRAVIIGEGGDKTRSGTVASLMLSNDKVQCSSCHDVHNNFVGPATADQPFLRVSKAGSKLCLTCHNK
ncbi:MAG: cytochrome c3 family protein [Gammaproteobacteria bacterium]|nr:cytochrome c3 family protein [Gammaproteobacteria bacterium]